MEISLIFLISAVTFYIITKGIEVLAKIDRNEKQTPKPQLPNPVGFTAKHKETRND